MSFLKQLQFAFLISISIVCLAIPSAAADSKALDIIDANEIRNLGQQSLLVYDNFLESNWPKIVHYNSCGKFFNPANSHQLFQQSNKLKDSLQIINNRQQTIQHLIANYNKPDWDKRFGRTNIWRQLKLDIYLSSLMICYSDYFSALVSKPNKRNKIATTALIKLKQLQKKNTTAKDKLLESKFSSLLGNNILAVKLALEIIKDSTVSDEIFWQAILQKLAIENSGRKNIHCENIEKIVNQFIQSDLTNNFQLWLKLSLLQRDCNSHNFEPLIKKWPQLSSIVGKIIFTDLEHDHDQDLNKFNNFDIRLVATVCLDLQPETYCDLIDKLLKIEKFQSVELFLAKAATMRDIDQLRYAEFLIDAAICYRNQADCLLAVDMNSIAQEAVKISCYIFNHSDQTTDKNNPTRLRAIAIIDNYNQITDSCDLPMVLAHGIMLKKIGKSKESQNIFNQLAGSGDRNISNRAKTFLALIELAQFKESTNPLTIYRQQSLLNQLAKITLSDIDFSDSHFVIKFISNIINKIEIFDAPKSIASNCLTVISKYKQCLNHDITISALEAESAAIADELQILERTIHGMDLTAFPARVQARIAQSSSNHILAATCWQTVLAAENSSSNRYEQSWHWWRAKYYQLYNLHKSRQLDCSALSRNIAILQTSYRNIPALWNQKLSLLDQNCDN